MGRNLSMSLIGEKVIESKNLLRQRSTSHYLTYVIHKF